MEPISRRRRIAAVAGIWLGHVFLVASFLAGAVVMLGMICRGPWGQGGNDLVYFLSMLVAVGFGVTTRTYLVWGGRMVLDGDSLELRSRGNRLQLTGVGLTAAGVSILFIIIVSGAMRFI